MPDVNSSYPPAKTRDSFSSRREELDSPSSRAFPITPSQSFLPTDIRGLYVGVSGNVFCRMAYGNTTHAAANVFFYNVIGGTILPIRASAVWSYNPERHTGDQGAITATGGNSGQNTTASQLVGLY